MPPFSKDWKHIEYDALSDSSHETNEDRPRGRVQTVFFTILSHATALLIGVAAYRFCDMTMLQHSQSPSLTPNLLSIIPESLLAYSETVRTNGTVDFPSIYRGTGPEVDLAWNELTGVGILDLDVSAEQLGRMGIDAMTVARYPEDDGGRYMLSIETFHQLHCVDLLRKVTHWNYDYYNARPDEDDSFRHPDQIVMHVDHCLEMMRQTLMCQADPTILSYHNVAVRRMPWPNFNTVHQCRNFDEIVAWAKKHERKTHGETAPPEDDAHRLEVVP